MTNIRLGVFNDKLYAALDIRYDGFNGSPIYLIPGDTLFRNCSLCHFLDKEPRLCVDKGYGMDEYSKCNSDGWEITIYKPMSLYLSSVLLKYEVFRRLRNLQNLKVDED